jgi:hypothetical protein
MATAEAAAYRGVGGWLLLFCLQLTVLGPLAMLWSLFTWFASPAGLEERFPALRMLGIIDALARIGLTIFGIRVAVGLLKLRAGAVQRAKTFLLSRLAYEVAAAILPFTAGLAAEFNEAMATQGIRAVLGTGLMVSVWYTYLTRSRRVKATYGLIEPAA